MYVCMYVRTYVCMYVSMYVCMYVGRYLCMYVCMFVRLYVCMYVCMYVTVSSPRTIFNEYFASLYSSRADLLHMHIHARLLGTRQAK